MVSFAYELSLQPDILQLGGTTCLLLKNLYSALGLVITLQVLLRISGNMSDPPMVGFQGLPCLRLLHWNSPEAVPEGSNITEASKPEALRSTAGNTRVSCPQDSLVTIREEGQGGLASSSHLQSAQLPFSLV